MKQKIFIGIIIIVITCGIYFFNFNKKSDDFITDKCTLEIESPKKNTKVAIDGNLELKLKIKDTKLKKFFMYITLGPNYEKNDEGNPTLYTTTDCTYEIFFGDINKKSFNKTINVQDIIFTNLEDGSETSIWEDNYYLTVTVSDAKNDDIIASKVVKIKVTEPK